MTLRGLRLFAAAVLAAALALTAFGGSAAGSPATAKRAQVDTITLDTLPIANALPLTLGIQKGYFAKQNIEIKTNTLQSGNDIVLALANNQAAQMLESCRLTLHLGGVFQERGLGLAAAALSMFRLF